MVTSTWPSLGPLNQYATIIIIITSVFIIINTGATCPATTMTHTLYQYKIPVLSTQPLHRESQILAQLTMLPTWPPHGHKIIQYNTNYQCYPHCHSQGLDFYPRLEVLPCRSRQPASCFTISSRLRLLLFSRLN